MRGSHCLHLNHKLLATSDSNSPLHGADNHQAWRYFGKIETPIAAGASNGKFEIWDMSNMTATGIIVEGVKNPGMGTYPSDPNKIVGITRCAWSGIWILSTANR